MKTITVTLKEYQHRKLKERAARAELPLEHYIVAAASDPLKYAWLDAPPPTAQLDI